LLKEVVPNPERIAILLDQADSSAPLFLNETAFAASRLGLQLRPQWARTTDELDPALELIGTEGAAALIVSASTLFNVTRSPSSLVVRTCGGSSRFSINVCAVRDLATNHAPFVSAPGALVDLLLTVSPATSVTNKPPHAPSVPAAASFSLCHGPPSLTTQATIFAVPRHRY
jgi:hypothetical protein